MLQCYRGDPEIPQNYYLYLFTITQVELLMQGLYLL